MTKAKLLSRLKKLTKHPIYEGSHCSCYGLENQWDRDEEIVVEELVRRVT